ncbi:MAG: S16 family serine protease [Actinomycetota bacterium]
MNQFPPSIPLPQPRTPTRRWWRLVVVTLVFGVALGLIGAYVTIPYYTLGPGPARNVAQLVHIDGQRVYPSDGGFFLTTVAVSTREISLFEGLVAWLDPAVSTISRSDLVPKGLTDEQYSQYNALDMEESKYGAIIAAMRAVGVDSPLVPGARVIGVAGGFPAEGHLKQGDLIVGVDGHEVTDPRGAVDRVVARPVGSIVEIEFVRDDKHLTTKVKTIRSPLRDQEGVPVIGVRLAPAFLLPFGVTIDSQNIGGPSAGLAFALSVVDAVTPEDLTRGHLVAVTGTILGDGRVGPVGGVEFKVRAAEREGADVFLVPSIEVDQAEKVAKDIKIIGVDTLADAIAELRKLARVARRPAA